VDCEREPAVPLIGQGVGVVVTERMIILASRDWRCRHDQAITGRPRSDAGRGVRSTTAVTFGGAAVTSGGDGRPAHDRGQLTCDRHLDAPPRPRRPGADRPRGRAERRDHHAHQDRARPRSRPRRPAGAAAGDLRLAAVHGQLRRCPERQTPPRRSGSSRKPSTPPAGCPEPPPPGAAAPSSARRPSRSTASAYTPPSATPRRP